MADKNKIILDILNFILKTVDEDSFKWIAEQYSEMDYEFPDTYEDFLEDQREEVLQLDMDALNFARYLKENIENNKVQNMDLENAVPFDTAAFYYYNGKIVIFNYR